MKRLTKKLGEQFVESERLVREIKVELTNQGYSM